MPPPINSHSDRWRGDASASRGNHTRGTETTRPSVSVTESASIEQDTSTTSASVFSVKVLIPSLQKELRVLNNYFSDIVHLIRPKPLASATPTGSSQNFAYRSAWATWICGGSRPSILKKKNRYPLTLSRLGTSQVYRVASSAIRTLRRATVMNPRLIGGTSTLRRLLFSLALFLSFRSGLYLFRYVGWWSVILGGIFGFGSVLLLVFALTKLFGRKNG